MTCWSRSKWAGLAIQVRGVGRDRVQEGAQLHAGGILLHVTVVVAKRLETALAKPLAQPGTDQLHLVVAQVDAALGVNQPADEFVLLPDLGLLSWQSVMPRPRQPPRPPHPRATSRLVVLRLLGALAGNEEGAYDVPFDVERGGALVVAASEVGHLVEGPAGRVWSG